MNIVLEWPQLIYILLTLIGLVFVSMEHGKPYTRDANASLIATIIIYGLLYWGGFFS